MIKKILLIIFIIVVALVGLSLILQMCDIDNDKPPGKVDETNFRVITTSRIYYTDSFEWEGDTIILHGFWVKEGDRWKQYERDLPMPRESYGKVEVRER